MEQFLNWTFVIAFIFGFVSTAGTIICGLWPCPDYVWRLCLTVLYLSLLTGIASVLLYGLLGYRGRK